jgi:hypothetical protein
MRVAILRLQQRALRCPKDVEDRSTPLFSRPTRVKADWASPGQVSMRFELYAARVQRE